MKRWLYSLLGLSVLLQDCCPTGETAADRAHVHERRWAALEPSSNRAQPLRAASWPNGKTCQSGADPTKKHARANRCMRRTQCCSMHDIQAQHRQRLMCRTRQRELPRIGSEFCYLCSALPNHINLNGFPPKTLPPPTQPSPPNDQC